MVRIALVALGSVLLLVGCSENGLNNLQPDLGGFSGRIEVHPNTLDFGTLRAGEEAVKTFHVSNVGDDELRVESVTFEGSGSFAILSDMSEFQLPPGAVESFDVLFTPLGGYEQVGLVAVASSDRENPEEEVDLLGFGAVPELSIDPPAYDFGTDTVGCTDETEILLSNVGTDDLVVTALSYSDPAAQLSLDAPLALPLTLAPGQSTSVTVVFAPNAEVVSHGRIDVTSNDPRGLVRAEQTAEGAYAAWNTETFQVPADPPVDLLFAVDQSGSMDAHAAQLATSFSGLISGISAVTSGWQIGVVTSQDGCFDYPIMTASTPNLQSTFSAAVAYGYDATATWSEELFAMVQLALAQTGSGGCNQGLLRPGALLHVIFVSDEWEQSGISASSFVSSTQGYASSPSLFKTSGIICSDAGCGHYDGQPYGYREAIALTGGVRLDVMASSWSSYAQTLAAASLTAINRFQLAGNPDPTTITVWVDGVQWMAGWHYDTATNEIVFDSNPPRLASIDVEYGEMGCI